MPESFEQNKIHNAELLAEAQFALRHRSEPTLTLMSVSDYGLRQRLVEQLKEKLPEYQFYDLDLTSHHVVSLHQSLQKLLPDEVLHSPPITYCINVFGLENSRLVTQKGQVVDSGLIAQLNFEREVVFRRPNYLTILWADHDFFVQLQRQAPDFWSWVTYFFEFRQEEPYEEIVPPSDPVPVHEARLPEREAYIKSLEKKLDSLPLNAPDKLRTTKERLNLYSLLAKEYADFFDYENSKKYYEYALRLCEQLSIAGDEEKKLLFEFATVHIKFRYFDEALQFLNKIVEKLAQQGVFEKLGVVYHQIGIVYQQQHQWKLALESYGQALDWKKKTGQEHELGSTYHNIGMLHATQQKLVQALENFEQALKWYYEAGQEYEIGTTYNQLGRIYQQRRQWTQALENYGKALRWKKNTGQEQELGATYKELGILYLEKKQWTQALENFHLALEWYRKTGQEPQLGTIYHELGVLYAEQYQWDLALKNYGEALEWYQKTAQDHEMSATYNQIGRAYAEQNQWTQALDSYGEALKWANDTGQEHQSGNTYHQIGITYEAQGNWSHALENYYHALEWEKKLGHKHELSATYHQIGRVYEEQNNLQEALIMFEKALETTSDYQENERSTITNSIQRVKEKIAEKIHS